MLAFRKILGSWASSFVLVLAVAGAAECSAWRGIVPLHSKRADVERLLGAATINRPYWAVYDYPTEKASIEYSMGPCTVEFSAWNVPRDTVISIFVTPRSDSVKFPDQAVNQDNSRKVRDEHREQIVHYINDKDGIEYTVEESSGIVGLIRYFPSADDKLLKCPGPSNRLRETIKIAQYASTTLSAEKKFLDKFAQGLIRYTSRSYASAEGYILAYDGQTTRLGQAMKHANRGKDYVVKKWGLDPNRIQIMQAGHHKRTTIELYLVPPGSGPPRRMQ